MTSTYPPRSHQDCNVGSVQEVPHRPFCANEILEPLACAPALPGVEFLDAKLRQPQRKLSVDKGRVGDVDEVPYVSPGIGHAVSELRRVVDENFDVRLALSVL